MSFFTSRQLAGVALLAAGAVTIIGGYKLFAQETASQPVLHGYFLTEPWTGDPNSLNVDSSSTAATIPLSTYTFAATKDSSSRKGTIVGTSPFAAIASSVTSVVVIPLKITIGTAVFDPGAPNTCDGGISTVNRFHQSPLATVSPLVINGINVGTTQFINGFRRAEFWTAIGGSAGYQNTLAYTYHATLSVAVTASHGITYSSGCSLLGIVSYPWFSSYLSGTLIPALTASGVISTSKFPIFLLKNVVQSLTTPPSVSSCCILGYHGAQGSPVQTYSPMDWDTTGLFGAGTADGSVASHEIGEWMDDPLGTNPTPNWGHIGQVSGCQNNLEVGDPLSGTLMPPITLSGYAYHMQELGFFSWYFNKNGVASLGTGGKFSSKGTFAGPSKACPPGGTY